MDIGSAQEEDKRQRHTLKMQRYRKRLLAKAEQLRSHVVSMEHELLHLKARQNDSNSILPWKIVAGAMQDACEHTRKDNSYLKAQCQQYHTTIIAMKYWVASNRCVTKSLSGLTPTWRNVTLCGHPTSRQLGFDWITRNMYNNTERIFQQCHFPSPEYSFHDFHVDNTSPNNLQCVWRDQRIVPYSLEAVRDHFARPRFFGMLVGSQLLKIPFPTPENDVQVVKRDNEMLRSFGSDPFQYIHSMWNQNAHVHFLAREFNDTDRCIFVAQGIHDDELLENDEIQRDRMRWIMLQRLDKNRTLIRAVSISSQAFTKESFVTLDEEAALWGMKSSCTDMKWNEHQVVQWIVRCCTRNPNPYEGALKDALKNATS